MSEAESTEAGGSAIELRRSTLGLLRVNLSVLGAGFAWFAYIDAPISDGAMRLIAAAVLAGVLCVIATLACGQLQSDRVRRRWWRVGLWSFALMTALMLTAATATLNLKGSGSDESDTQTAVINPA